jgi:peptidoglycan/xylan/chitin deacetylase (PgdA/CDA1 family)
MASRSWPGLAVAAAVGWSGPALAAHSAPLCDLLGVRRRRAGDGATVHLTFDDGPHPEGTPAVLEALAAQQATATFFLVGEQVERFPAIAREIVAAGHVVALHGHRHRSQLRVPPRALADDLRRGSDVIASTTGRLAPLYRPPYGIFSAAGLALARRRGDEQWLWSRWGRDWRGAATAWSVAQLASGELDAGDVILLHDADHYADAESWRATAGAVPLILDAIEARGLRTAPL